MPLITSEPPREAPIYGVGDRAAYSESIARHAGVSGPPKIPRDRTIQSVQLQQRFFAVGKSVLELKQNPTLRVDLGKREFEVVGWSLTLPYGREQSLGRELLRKFLFLFYKAEQIDLSEQEEHEWASIVAQVNYRRFCLDRAVPRYCEGKLIDRDGTACKIEWVDGAKESVTGAIVAELAVLDIGERFGGYGKFGAENKLLSLTTVRILPPISEDASEFFNEWPTNR